MRIASTRDFALGLLVLAFAGFGLWQVRSLPIGTAAEMQAGYFPRLIFWLLAGLGLLCLLRSVLQRKVATPDLSQPDWLRPTIGVIASVIAFGLAIKPLGLVPASALLCLIAGFSSARSRPVEIILLAAGLATAAALIFIVGLGLPIAMWPRL